MPDGSEEKHVGSDATTASNASSSRVLPRVEAGDVLLACDGFGNWKLKTGRLIRFYGAMSMEGVIAPDYEDQAIILTARLSPAILQEGRDFCESFTDMWKWLNERHEKSSSKLNVVHYSKLAMIKMTAEESVEEYVFRADTHLSVLQAAPFKFDMDVVVRAVIDGLHPHFASMAAPLLFADSIKTVVHVRDGF